MLNPLNAILLKDGRIRQPDGPGANNETQNKYDQEILPICFFFFNNNDHYFILPKNSPLGN